MSYKTAIHDLLVTTGAAGAFKQARYTSARPSLLVEGADISPASVEANEVRGSFGIDGQYGRDFRQERQGWAWLLVMRFDGEAILQAFEDSLMQSPLFIARDVSDGRPQAVRLLMEDSAYEHPPRGGASNGTEVTYRFVAELCRQ